LMPPYCPECGGKLKFDPKLKHYSCQSCGVTYNEAELSKALEERYVSRETDDEKRQQRHQDYLEWWLSDKDKKKRG